MDVFHDGNFQMGFSNRVMLVQLNRTHCVKSWQPLRLHIDSYRIAAISFMLVRIDQATKLAHNVYL